MGTQTIEGKIRAGIMIPLRQLNEHELEHLQSMATWDHYADPYECKKCPEEDEKPNNCGNCPNFTRHKFYERRSVGKEPSIIFRKGYLNKLKKFFGGKLDLTDYQTYAPMKAKKYHFYVDMLNPGQLEARNVLLKKLRNGESVILKSPPRTGKTVMATSIIMAFKKRTIFIAHQSDLLVGKGQLISTFIDKTKDDASQNPGRYFTNLYKYIAKGKEPVKFARTLEDFLESDICLTTYQIFLHPRGKEILEQIKDKFGLLVIDECFPEYVDVVMSDDSKDSIKSLVERFNAGETLYVKSKNLQTGEVEDKRVISTNSKNLDSNELMRLHYPGGYLDCTDNHPIWSHTRNCYIRADSIQEGEDVEIY